MAETLSFLLIFLLTLHACSGGVGDNRGESFADAAKRWTLAAQQGDSDAQFKLGLMHDSGTSVPRDFNEAMTWYRRAAAAFDPV